MHNWNLRSKLMDVFEKALCFATEKHSGQLRKLAKTPYILHPIEVAAIVGTMTDDRELLAAAVLHDTVEDTDTTLEEIEEHFGRRVSLLVMTETEEKRENRPPAETWQLRKEETLAILESTKDIEVKMMWLGDKLSNMRSFSREFRKKGDAVWQALNQKDPKKQAWYYVTIAKALKDLKDTDAYLEYVSLVKFVFKEHLGGSDYEILG
ncbi:MAG: bifunctional (p)ppGpp synthetase/guanosine-3',5'-bis(diphosphate) 3'-pyrophosphohydrolase [Clostridiales bacterium]|nr:bifunctional (p)ppGpp synthetase/guanosine-3',5'-bis(diphosphate) 3'-pyrophosphohydrolase [Candidatus Equinaster intestinalis]